jgi:hypothetical protein
MKKFIFGIIFWLLLVPALCFGGQYLKFDAQTGAWTVTNTITGATSGATAVIASIQDDGTTGILELNQVSGTFANDEIIYEAALGAELITNGNMEADSDWSNWDSPTTNERSIEQVHNGTYSRKFIGNNSTDGIMNSTAGGGGISSGNFYFVDSYIYISALTALQLDVAAYSNAITLLGFSYTNITGSWVNVPVIVRATDTNVRVLIAQNDSGAITVYADDVSVKQITNAALANGAPYGSGKALLY